MNAFLLYVSIALFAKYLYQEYFDNFIPDKETLWFQTTFSSSACAIKWCVLEWKKNRKCKSSLKYFVEDGEPLFVTISPLLRRLSVDKWVLVVWDGRVGVGELAINQRCKKSFSEMKDSWVADKTMEMISNLNLAEWVPPWSISSFITLRPPEPAPVIVTYFFSSPWALHEPLWANDSHCYLAIPSRQCTTYQFFALSIIGWILIIYFILKLVLKL